MKTAILAVGLFLLATGVLPPSDANTPVTVDQLQAKFIDFGPQYVEFRKMPNEPAQEKKDALEELWQIVEANHWHEDTDTNFYLASLDPATFNTGADKLFAQLNIILTSTKTDLKIIQSHGLFQDPAIKKDKVTGGPKKKLEDIELFVKEKIAGLAEPPTNASKIAYHYELFNGQDLTKANDPNARKEYALIMFAIATE